MWGSRCSTAPLLLWDCTGTLSSLTLTYLVWERSRSDVMVLSHVAVWCERDTEACLGQAVPMAQGRGFVSSCLEFRGQELCVHLSLHLDLVTP